jgi:hypothetical protein
MPKIFDRFAGFAAYRTGSFGALSGKVLARVARYLRVGVQSTPGGFRP